VEYSCSMRSFARSRARVRPDAFLHTARSPASHWSRGVYGAAARMRRSCSSRDTHSWKSTAATHPSRSCARRKVAATASLSLSLSLSLPPSLSLSLREGGDALPPRVAVPVLTCRPGRRGGRRQLPRGHVCCNAALHYGRPARQRFRLQGVHGCADQDSGKGARRQNSASPGLWRHLLALRLRRYARGKRSLLRPV
jgi:hypothetical protein